jgi:hypothetical protein
LLGKTRACPLIEAGDGVAEWTQGLIGWAENSIGFGEGKVVNEDLNHKPASSRPRRYISWACSGRHIRSRTRPIKW